MATYTVTCHHLPPTTHFYRPPASLLAPPTPATKQHHHLALPCYPPLTLPILPAQIFAAQPCFVAVVALATNTTVDAVLRCDRTLMTIFSTAGVAVWRTVTYRTASLPPCGPALRHLQDHRGAPACCNRAAAGGAYDTARWFNIPFVTYYETTYRTYCVRVVNV